MLCPCSGTTCQLPIARCAGIWLKIAASTCWWDKSSFCICCAILLALPRRRILSPLAIGTIQSVRRTSLAGTCFFSGSLSQILFVNARSRLASFCRHASSELIFWKGARAQQCVLWLLRSAPSLSRTGPACTWTGGSPSILPSSPRLPPEWSKPLWPNRLLAKPTFAKPTFAKPTLAKVKVFVVCKDFFL